ncbi:MAG: hypothetical protein U5L96_19550 [Owenweeksia sp.]|nr:hypothetical protein [Owenweeksia sp.]
MPVTPLPPPQISCTSSRHQNFGIKTFQAEDEIAAITAAIGASFAGSLAVTATSGPGMALKSESLGLALMLELPLVVVNVQRGGPSTGLPTKTEQADRCKPYTDEMVRLPCRFWLLHHLQMLLKPPWKQPALPLNT